MSSQPLTPNDSSVLTHIFDPESASATPNILLDDSLPSDPHIRDPHLLKTLQRHEQQIISTIELTPVPRPQQQSQPQLSPTHFNTAYESFTTLIISHPNYASAHNNRAQLIRLRYGNSILIQPQTQTQPQSPDTTDLRTDTLRHAHTALNDLNRAIALLTPPSPLSPTTTTTTSTTPQTTLATISPLQRKTLTQAHTQRAALFHAAGKTLSSISSSSAAAAATITTTTTTTTFLFAVPGLEKWSANDFEEVASRDFRAAGAYGSELGRVLGVAVNPTAKLCGEMVRGAMRREVKVGAGAAVV